jgi:hypothetical protein
VEEIDYPNSYNWNLFKTLIPLGGGINEREQSKQDYKTLVARL